VRIYICGRIDSPAPPGHPIDNRPAFYEAEERLVAAGLEAVNPLTLCPPNWRPDPDFHRTEAYRRLVTQCLELLERCDGVAQTPGWMFSNGARKETRHAWFHDIPAAPLDEWVPPIKVVEGPRAMHWTGDPECAPVRHYRGDAGFDLTVSEDRTIKVDGFADVPLGISVALPEGIWGLLTGRSSTIRKRGILVGQGIIDQGYRGPLFAACTNLSGEVAEIRRGDRIAQLIPLHLGSEAVRPVQVEELDPSDRGTNGFGSTDDLSDLRVG
jgi:dUTP pyrophosphatase